MKWDAQPPCTLIGLQCVSGGRVSPKPQDKRADGEIGLSRPHSSAGIRRFFTPRNCIISSHSCSSGRCRSVKNCLYHSKPSGCQSGLNAKSVHSTCLLRIYSAFVSHRRLLDSMGRNEGTESCGGTCRTLSCVRIVGTESYGNQCFISRVVAETLIGCVRGGRIEVGYWPSCGPIRMLSWSMPCSSCAHV
jgi:hypothetical protein